MYHGACAERAEDKLLETVFSFCLVGPGDWTRVVGFDI